MVRRTLLLLAATLALLAMPVAPALAGGGCHEGATTGSGDTVEMVNLCFTPTTLRVDPGDTVTFVNRDGFAHMVGANGWGHFEDLNEGDAFTATFDQPGTYAYACNYHPGMTGAIVVGDGTGAGNGDEVTVASYEQPAPSPQVEIRTVGAVAEGSGTSVGWVAAAAVAGAALGLGAGLVRRRRPVNAP